MGAMRRAEKRREARQHMRGGVECPEEEGGYYGLFTVAEEGNRRESLILKQFTSLVSIFEGLVN